VLQGDTVATRASGDTVATLTSGDTVATRTSGEHSGTRTLGNHIVAIVIGGAQYYPQFGGEHSILYTRILLEHGSIGTPE
jgi:hypothetical protein